MILWMINYLFSINSDFYKVVGKGGIKKLKLVFDYVWIRRLLYKFEVWKKEIWVELLEWFKNY